MNKNYNKKKKDKKDKKKKKLEIKTFLKMINLLNNKKKEMGIMMGGLLLSDTNNDIKNFYLN